MSPSELAATSLTETIKPIDLLDEFDVRIDGAAPDDYSGGAVSDAGDVNGDGLDDTITGAEGADNNGRDTSGSAYVVFGQRGKGALDLANLNAMGFRIDGAATFDRTGISVSGAGDVNGDGKDDLIVGAPGADRNARPDSGTAWVVFGSDSTATLDLKNLGSRGFPIDGAAASDNTGISVSGAGDINHDGKDDLVVGANQAYNNGRVGSGSTFVVFGQAATRQIDLARLGSSGFRVDGAAAYDQAGFSVSGAGDINGDQINDLVIGAYRVGNNGRINSGSAYAVFGKIDPDPIDLAALGSQGFAIDGAHARDETGWSVSGGVDVNEDGLDDLVIGAPEANANDRKDSGTAYAVFGKIDPDPIDLAALGSRGFRMDGAAIDDNTGYSVSVADDINGGGDDLIIGAWLADKNGRGHSGSIYAVYGKATSTPIDFAALGVQGFRVDGSAQEDWAGVSVSGAGDVNKDGVDDLLLGAFGADYNGRSGSGSSYIIHGPYAGY